MVAHWALRNLFPAFLLATILGISFLLSLAEISIHSVLISGRDRAWCCFACVNEWNTRRSNHRKLSIGLTGIGWRQRAMLIVKEESVFDVSIRCDSNRSDEVFFALSYAREEN